MREADESLCPSCSHLESRHCEGLAWETGTHECVFLPAHPPCIIISVFYR